MSWNGSGSWGNQQQQRSSASSQSWADSSGGGSITSRLLAATREPEPAGWKRPGYTSQVSDEPDWKRQAPSRATMAPAGRIVLPTTMPSGRVVMPASTGGATYAAPRIPPPSVYPNASHSRSNVAAPQGGWGHVVQPSASPTGKFTAGAAVQNHASASSAQPTKQMPPAMPVVLPGSAASKEAQIKDKATKSGKEVEAIEQVIVSAIGVAKEAFQKEDSTEQALRSALSSLDAQHTKIIDVQKRVATELGDAKQVGPSVSSSAVDLAKISTKCKSLGQNIALQMNKLKLKVSRFEAEAALKGKETKDASAWKLLVTKLKADVTAAENALSAVAKQAMVVVAKAPEDAEARDKKVASIETAVAEPFKKLEAARTSIKESFASVQSYAPEAKKSAQAGLAELTKKITEAMKTGAVYKDFKVHFPKLAENQKNLDTVTEKLAGHEPGLAKASELAKAGILTKKSIATIDKHLEPVQKATRDVVVIFATKFKAADAATFAKVAVLKTKSEELKKKMDAVITVIKGQRDAMMAEEAVETAEELVEKVESGWKMCVEAEMPFLTGVEVLPHDQNEDAIKKCNNGLAVTCSAIGAAKAFVSKKLVECKTYEKELANSTAAGLKPFLLKISDIDNKMAKFRQEMTERKITGQLSDALDVVETSEKVVDSAEKAVKALLSGNLEDQEDTAIKEIIGKAKTMLAEATADLTKAKTVAAEKQKASKATDKHPMMIEIKEVLKSTPEKIGRIRSSILKAEQVIKTKAALITGEESVKQAEEKAEEAKNLASVDEFTAQTATDLDKACSLATNAGKAAFVLLQPIVGMAPAKTKKVIEELLARKTAALAEVDKVKKDTKDRREDTLCNDFLTQAEAKVKAAEELGKTMEKAESIFLVGNELELEHMREVLSKCAVASKETLLSLTVATQYITRVGADAKTFGEGAAKKLKDAITELSDRVKAIRTKHAVFQKDTAEREREANMMESVEKVDELEALVQKTLAAGEPFTKEGAEEMTEAEAETPLEAFLNADSEAQKKLSATSTYLNTRQKGKQGQTDEMKSLLERVSTAKASLAALKVMTAAHERRALGKRLLTEVQKQVADLEHEVQNVRDVCAPLLEEDGAHYSVGNSLNTLGSALSAHMKDNDLTTEAIFKEISEGEPLSEDVFDKYLEDLPDAIKNDDICFSEERRSAMFKRLATDLRSVTLEDFTKGIFRQSYICLRSIALTDKCTVEDSKTLRKVEPGTVLEAFGHTKEDAGGLIRRECEVDDKLGWITIKQGNNPYVTQITPWKRCCMRMEKSLSQGTSIAGKLLASIQVKMKEGGSTEEAALKEARSEMAKLKDTVLKAQASIEALRKKVTIGKSSFEAQEQAEQAAHILAKNLREARHFINDPQTKLEALEVTMAALDDAAAPMMSLSEEELEVFETPASVMEEVGKLSAVVKREAAEAREAIKEQTKVVNAVTPQTGVTLEAKKQLKPMSVRVEELFVKTTKTIADLNAKGKTLVTSRLVPTAAAIRKLAVKQEKTIEELFITLKQGNKIPQEAFCKMLQSLEDVELSSEVARLLCRSLEADGISKEVFMRFVAVYYKVVRTIAYTDALDVKICQTVRKAVEGEVMEILEGPVINGGMTRVRGRSLKDKIEGWITVSGTKGTPFLEKTGKPASMS